ncbi:porin [Paraburkholderia humisilvae]|uniref:Outer membrane porin protein n=1 Tax=Paraburkholderia humisilvae TaxID=627669 RepID=A0A6J5CVQ4_9BURK|nr:Outer membrane porin protein [Paraburkholderia humisilvae]
MNSTIHGSIAGASLAILSTTCAAQAVSLYGELDTGLAYVNNVNGHAQYRATSGLIDGSYWGLQGTEELGGGAKAVFRLERGFSVTSGEGFNDHPAYVGLQSDAFGTLTLGHQYDLVHDYFAPFALTGGTGGTAFAHPFDNDNANNTYLASNSVKYASPSFGGFSLGGMYAFSNEAGAFANNRAYSIGANYQGGALSAGAAWLHVNGRGNTSGGAYDPVVLPGSTGEVFNANVGTQNTYGVGASYTIGDFVLAAAWSRSTYSDVVNADAGDAAPSVGFSNYEVNGVYQLTPAISFAGMYTYTKASTAHWHEGAVQMTYALSKRTDTYVEAVYQHASSGAPAVINTNDPSSSGNQLLIGAGIRHHF